jgi:hypothetical protein
MEAGLRMGLNTGMGRKKPKNGFIRVSGRMENSLEMERLNLFIMTSNHTKGSSSMEYRTEQADRNTLMEEYSKEYLKMDFPTEQ